MQVVNMANMNLVGYSTWFLPIIPQGTYVLEQINCGCVVEAMKPGFLKVIQNNDDDNENAEQYLS